MKYLLSVYAREPGRGSEPGIGTEISQDALRLLGQVHALVHPSLHDSGGWVCLEAMAAGRPVLCLDLGGPATQVTRETGFKVSGYTPDQAVGDMAEAMVQIATDRARCLQMGNAAKARVVETFLWKARVGQIAKYYSDII